MAVPDSFNHTYNNIDPRSYFCGLQALDYRMPAVTAGFLKNSGSILSESRGKSTLRLVDFACGYGAIGQLLKTDLTQAEIYDFYGSAPVGPCHPWDQGFFQARRRAAPGFEVIGVDIAERALDYATLVGAVDHPFVEDLVENPPSTALSRHLSEADIILECGSPGQLLEPALGHLLTAADPATLPWILLSPRPDAVLGELWPMLDRFGFVRETCNRQPIRYRKFAGEIEKAGVFAAIEKAGGKPSEHVAEDYLLVDLILARPAHDISSPPIEVIRIDGN